MLRFIRSKIGLKAISMANEKVEKEMGLMDHISDLRKCLIHCSWFILIFSIVAFIFRDEIFHFLWDPYEKALKKSELTKVVYSSITDPFTVAINQSLLVGFLLASPFIIYEVFTFIAPAWKPKELMAIRIYSFVSLILFVGGVLLGYGYMLPHLAEVMEELRLSGTESYLNAKDMLQTIIKLILGLGLIFQFPLVLFFVVKVGLIQLSTITKNRKIIIVLILIISAFATPPDLMSLFVVSIPFYILFEITLVCCWIFIKPPQNN